MRRPPRSTLFLHTTLFRSPGSPWRTAMPRVTKKPTEDVPTARMPDALEVIHTEVPQDAAGLAAVPLGPAASAPAATTLSPHPDGGLPWRRMLRATALTAAVGMTVLLVGGMASGVSFFAA